MTRTDLMQLRPLINMPTWDGKIVLAALFFVGYYLMTYTLTLRGINQSAAAVVRDAMLQLGPPIGVIVGALFRSTGAEERAQALRSADLQTAITTPSITGTGDGEAAVRRGAQEGSRAGVAEGIGDAVGDGKPPASPPPVAGTEVID